jgi:hypothetical protein
MLFDVLDMPFSCYRANYNLCFMISQAGKQMKTIMSIILVLEDVVVRKVILRP